MNSLATGKANVVDGRESTADDAEASARLAWICSGAPGRLNDDANSP
jgi:hypothetical protein